MKRIILLLMAAALLLSLAACGPGGAGKQEENFSFTHNGTRIVLGAEAGPVLAALGEPISCTEEPSCAFAGMDRTYYYGSFYLTTCPMEDGDHVSGIWFADDTAATEEGLRIGATQSQAEAVCGAGSFGDEGSCAQTRGSSERTVILENGAVSSIQYSLILD